MKNKRINNAALAFIRRPANNSILFCDNGIFRLEFKAKNNPTYFAYSVDGYNKLTGKFEFIHSYGSPFISDVINCLKFEQNN